jgi:hypothetical protein
MRDDDDWQLAWFLEREVASTTVAKRPSVQLQELTDFRAVLLSSLNGPMDQRSASEPTAEAIDYMSF